MYLPENPPEVSGVGTDPCLDTQLCSACDNLDLEDMFRGERNERSMGPLSNFSHPSCPFCNLISQSIALAWGKGWDSARLCSETSSSPQLFMQSRSPLSVKEDGQTEHPQPRLIVAIDREPSNFQRNRATLREIDRVKDRFIIAEIESLPTDSKQPSSKETLYISRREVGERVNIPLVKCWLEECKTHRHSKAVDHGHDNLFQPEHPFRLIDVVDECLVQKSEKCDYATLSYVWGRIPTILYPGDDPKVTPILLTTIENVTHLSTPGALSLSQQSALKGAKIPRTVRDAIELTRKIGLRHLWVDTLCIIQNDSDDKGRLIGKMDDVYDNATLTIVAAAGDDADAGLKGVSPRTGYPIKPARIVDSGDGWALNLSLCPPALGEHVRSATWNTRGWTFQEGCLSQRCLYFTPEETFFNCPEIQRREGYDYGQEKSREADVEVRTGPPWWSQKLRKDLDPTPYHYLGDINKRANIQDYQIAVQDYSRKNLTFQRDILNAFLGIYNRFKQPGDASKLSIQQTQGIPAHLLFQALLWFPSDGSQKRVCEPYPDGAVDRLSTWSWPSRTGPVDFVFADSLWLSRNISQAPIKRVPIHVPVPCWHYGVSTQSFWSQDIWSPAGSTTIKQKDQLSRTKSYLKSHSGIDIDLLLDRSQREVPPKLLSGELGFHGAYLPSSEFDISAEKSPHVRTLQVSTHHGEFRFDGEAETVDELVAVVAADTITKPPDAQTILLGLTTREGISSRVGIGFIYYSKVAGAPKPKWLYRYFRVQ